MYMKKTFDLLTLGEILLRLSPNENERLVQGDDLKRHIGGAELNVSTGVSLLGLQTGMLSKLPNHAMGIYARNKFRSMGVSDQYITYDMDENARIGIYFYENGAYPRKPNVVYDRKYTSINKLKQTDFPDELFHSTKCFHTSGITLALSPQVRETTIELIKRFKKSKTLISFDVNFRGNLWTGEEAKKHISSILPYVDIFFCSEDTARLTFQKEGMIKDILKSFTDEYPIQVISATQRIVHSPKIHSFSSMVYEKQTNTYYEEKPYEKIEVVDRIGSGDAYIAGFLYGILKENGNCQTALEYGNAIGAIQNTILGDLPVFQKQEIQQIIQEHKANHITSELIR